MGGVVRGPENPIPVAGELPDDLFSQFANTEGRFSGAFSECAMIEWNDRPALERLLARSGAEIAAVIVEPVMVNNYGCNPEPGYLEGVRELCTDHGVLRIFDDVLTGFRIGLTGAQGHFGVTPDLASLAKALGAGFPVSSTSGRREVMDALTRADAIQGGPITAIRWRWRQASPGSRNTGGRMERCSSGLSAWGTCSRMDWSGLRRSTTSRCGCRAFQGHGHSTSTPARGSGTSPRAAARILPRWTGSQINSRSAASSPACASAPPPHTPRKTWAIPSTGRRRS